MTRYWEDTPEYTCFRKLGLAYDVSSIFYETKDARDAYFFLEGDDTQYYCPDIYAEVPVYYPRKD